MLLCVLTWVWALCLESTEKTVVVRSRSWGSRDVY
jgi:hypothetical protein